MADAVRQFAGRTRAELSKVIVGHDEALQQLLIVLLCGGHALLEGVPGIAKTLTVKVLAHICRLEFHRVQCTSDLMPADILGTSVYSMSTGTFSLRRGPVFTDLLLVDEVNRMPPRTQAALLECMEERQVTIDGAPHALTPFFTVFATQNPIEFEGTYPLPEAQLDRFLLKIRIGYPTAEEETELLNRYQSGFNARALDQVGLERVQMESLEAARREVAAVRVEPGLLGYVGAIVRKTRDWPALSLGASPRATVNLMQTAKAFAAIDGRDYLVPDDVKGMAPAVLRHRLLIKPEADLEGITPDHVVAEVLAAVEVPR